MLNTGFTSKDEKAKWECKLFKLVQIAIGLIDRKTQGLQAIIDQKIWTISPKIQHQRVTPDGRRLPWKQETSFQIQVTISKETKKNMTMMVFNWISTLTVKITKLQISLCITDMIPEQKQIALDDIREQSRKTRRQTNKSYYHI